MAAAEVVVVHNKETGKTWAVNPGTPAHARLMAGVARGECEVAEPKRRGRKPKPDEE